MKNLCVPIVLNRFYRCEVGTDVSLLFFCFSCRYVDYLNDALGSQGYTFTAKGYSGCSTSAVNNRLRSGAMANNCLSSPSSVTGFDIDDYDTLMVLSGLNDGLCSGTPTTTEGWLQEIYDYGESQGMKVIAITMTPAKSYFDGACSGGTAGGDNSVIYTVKVNDWITTGARHLDKIVDVYSVLNDGSGSLQSQYSRIGKLRKKQKAIFPPNTKILIIRISFSS